MLTIREEKDDSVHILALSGDLTISGISRLREKLIELYNSEDNVVVNLDSSSDIDFTFFQLMCSACRSFTSAGKSFSFNNNKDFPLALKTLCLGFARHTDCIHGECCSCLWTVKEKI